MTHSHRNTIFLEQAPILKQQIWPGEQYILRVAAPKTAATAQPGSFAQLQCDPRLPLRRPLSIMRVAADEGWVEFLYKAVGCGTRLLARRQVGDAISLLGPIGKPFIPERRRRPLLIGGGVGIPPMLFLAATLATDADGFQPLVILGSEVPFPFTPVTSRLAAADVPGDASSAHPLLEEWGVSSCLASRQGYAGCFDGTTVDLARHWLERLTANARAQVALYACGPEPMLKAVAALARDFQLPCQVSVEEYMACGVGGCAGCAVQVRTPQGPAMQRVCVDGPVFDADILSDFA